MTVTFFRSTLNFNGMMRSRIDEYLCKIENLYATWPEYRMRKMEQFYEKFESRRKRLFDIA